MHRRELFTVLLHHAWGDDSHYDWMIEDPAESAGEATLRTWRVDRPASDWAAAGELTLRALPNHRRAYLTYEGPLSGDRGVVTRVDAGVAVVESEDDTGLTLRVTMAGFEGLVTLRREAGGPAWRASFGK
ncbi:MAG: hypothetical protein GC159_19185 [Phycisphaera sp.]|nr:hypothetical protein [Phycisphaera sp.]